MLTTIAGIILDSVTLTTVAILATIALLGMATPTIAADVLPIMFAVFAVCVTSGTAKIVLNHTTRKGLTK